MTWPVWLCRLLPYLGRRQADADVEEEIRLHLELERERQRDAGVPEDKAQRAARRTLGNAALIRERTRDVWSWRWLDDLGRDLRHAARGLGRSPGFAATVVLLLALGIGANTAMFSIAYGLLLRPLPYPDAAAIVRVGYRSATRPGSIGWLTNSTLPRLQQEAGSFEEVAGYAPRNVVWNGPDGPVTLRGAMVSPSLFPLLRATPRLGGLLAADEAREGESRVVLLSHSAWTNRFASDPDIAGAPIELDGEPYTVAGVLAEGFCVSEPRGGSLDADGHVVLRPGPGCGGPHPHHLVRLLGARAPPPRRLPGAGCGRGRDPSAAAAHRRPSDRRGSTAGPLP